MKRAAAFLALMATACTTMEPHYLRPNPAIPASWPVGDPYLAQAEVGLPVLTYQQVFQDPRLQTLIAQAVANNRDLMVAAANIAAAREQYRIQRAQQFPTVDANGLPAFGQYKPSPSGGYDPWALQVVQLRDGVIGELTFFLATDEIFPLFGLPLHLDA